MLNDYMLDKVLNKLKKTIGIVELDDTKILIDADNKWPDYITLRNVIILMTCITEDDGKLYPEIFLEEALFVKKCDIQQDGKIGACQKMRKKK